jgi:cytochrome c556
MKKLVLGTAALALFLATPALSKPKKGKKAAEEAPAAEAPAAAAEEAPAEPEPTYTPEEEVDPALMGAISYRHTQMKLAGGHMKSIKLVVKGHESGTDEVLAHATALEAIASGMGNHWPEGSGHETGIEDMEAKAEIWTDAEGFAAAIAKFHEATTALKTAAEAGDMAAVGDALGGVGASCGGCHENYRD